MIFEALDIIAGLEQAFFSIFQLGNNSAPTVLQSRTTPASRVKRSRLYDISLFTLWQSLYDGFDSGRRSLWDAYWITLPFGSHSGANGWPGSGYSAFIYVNAPRYKNGDPLLYDPPAYPELVYNGGFVGNANGWELFDGAYYSSNAIHFDASSQYADFLQEEIHSFSVVDGATYRMECDYLLTAGATELYFYNRESADVIGTIHMDVGSGHLYVDSYITPGSYDPDFWMPYFLNFDDYSAGYITNISIRRIS